MHYAQEAASCFCDRFGFDKQSIIADDVSKMITEEAQYEIDRGTFAKQRNQWSKALNVALNRMCDWYENGKEWNIHPLHEFIASHRRSCAYGVLLRHFQCANEVHPSIFKGMALIRILGLKMKRNGRVDTSWGDKTPLGLARTVLRIMKAVEPGDLPVDS